IAALPLPIAVVAGEGVLAKVMLGISVVTQVFLIHIPFDAHARLEAPLLNRFRRAALSTPQGQAYLAKLEAMGRSPVKEELTAMMEFAEKAAEKAAEEGERL